MNYNKIKKPLPKGVLIAAIATTVLVLIGLGIYQYSISLNNAETNPDDTLQAEIDYGLDQSIKTENTNVEVLYPEGWQADLIQDEFLGETVELTNRSIDATVLVDTSLGVEPSEDVTDLTTDEQLEIYDFIVDEKTTELGGTISSRLKQGFDFASDTDRWIVYIIDYKKGQTDYQYTYVFQIKGSSGVNFVANNKTDDSGLTQAIISKVKIGINE